MLTPGYVAEQALDRRLGQLGGVDLLKAESGQEGRQAGERRELVSASDAPQGVCDRVRGSNVSAFSPE